MGYTKYVIFMDNFEYKIRTDLAVQNKSLKCSKSYVRGNITIKLFKDKEFDFTNIIYDKINNPELENIFIKEIKKYLRKYQFKKDSKVLVVGLGNQRIASDSLGVISVSHVIATGYFNHLDINNKKRSVYTYIPGVLRDTGYSAYQAIKALKRELKPDFVLIVDSLLSGSVLYLNKLIQITDRGITPGSGIYQLQREISFKTIGVPVIVIGIPTVIESSTIIKDALESREDKVVFQKGYDFIVASKDIDWLVKDMGKFLGESINQVLF